jgi:uncharacterized protein
MSDTAPPPERPFVALATAVPKPGHNVPSPCVNVCRMSPVSGWCEGCWRSLEEIRQWSRSSDADKKALWVLVEDRQRQAGLSPT